MFKIRFIVLMLFAATAVPMSAARLQVQGAVTDLVTRKALSGVLVRVYKDGVKQHVSTTGAAGRYDVVLDNNASYVIRFSMQGRITKCFAVETYGPAWEKDDRVIPLEVEMTLFEKVDDLDLAFFDLPMGIARFTPMTGHLAWNSTYEQRVKPEADRLMAEVALRREQPATSQHIQPRRPR
jgi:hypothetical protein